MIGEEVRFYELSLENVRNAGFRKIFENGTPPRTKDDGILRIDINRDNLIDNRSIAFSLSFS